MADNRGTRADLPPEGGVDEIKYDTDGAHEKGTPVDFVPDDDLEYTGEGGDGQTEPVPLGLAGLS